MIKSAISNSLFLVMLLGCIACSDSTQMTQQEQTNDKAAQVIIDQAIATHGGVRYQDARIAFDFRDKHYTSTRNAGTYTYTRGFQDESGKVEDVLSNEGFQRLVNGAAVTLSAKKADAYANSVNSVLYFAQLPYGLNDGAVIKKLIGESTIEGKNYHKIQVTFKQEGGGKDFQDVFFYWINQETNTLDFLAYKYETDGGGIRFRKAINPRVINGIRFVDYINYKPNNMFSDFNTIEQAYVDGKLEEVSRIINKNVEVALGDKL